MYKICETQCNLVTLKKKTTFSIFYELSITIIMMTMIMLIDQHYWSIRHRASCGLFFLLWALWPDSKPPMPPLFLDQLTTHTFSFHNFHPFSSTNKALNVVDDDCDIKVLIEMPGGCEKRIELRIISDHLQQQPDIYC